MVPSITLYDRSFPKMGSQNVPPRVDQLHDACCHLANMIEDINKISLSLWAERCRFLWPFAQLLWPLLIRLRLFYVGESNALSAKAQCTPDRRTVTWHPVLWTHLEPCSRKETARCSLFFPSEVCHAEMVKRRSCFEGRRKPRVSELRNIVDHYGS